MFKGTSFVWLHCWAWKQWADGDKRRDSHHHQSGELSLWNVWAALHGVTLHLNIRPNLWSAGCWKKQKQYSKWQKSHDLRVSWNDKCVCFSHSHTHRKEGRIKVAKLREQTWCHYSLSGAVQRSHSLFADLHTFSKTKVCLKPVRTHCRRKTTPLFFPSWRFSSNLLVSKLL